MMMMVGPGIGDGGRESGKARERSQHPSHVHAAHSCSSPLRLCMCDDG